MHFYYALLPYLSRLFPRSHMLAVKSNDMFPGLSVQVLEVCIDKNTVVSKNLP